ncbi:simple sugar transport system permease protein [Janthinobacterium psychrotolerans]|uniref:Simple sugar transport system permease protein n=2 Tax=Janthinobacterium psychrotolerans TaxID=1747903 RepID=A0A1A7C1Z3_9BURK|nr:simple sugar transport system permease protein [Janthinobacterium psychrotolerans]
MNTSTLKNSTVTMTAADLGAPKITVRQRLARHPQLFTLALIIAVCLVVGAINPEFFQLAMVFDIVRACTVLGLFALGVMIVLAAGGIDVSFAAIAALTMYGITKLVMTQFPETSMAVILIAGAVGGTLLGVLNGLMVDWLKAPSLIVTIGTQYLYRGILLTFVGTVFFMNVPHSMDAFGKLAVWRHDTATGVHAVLPATVLVLVAAAGLTWWLLNRTLMGRAVYAIGGSLPIAERLGYKLRAVHIFVFGYAGFLAGLAGIVHVSSTRLANPFDLVGMELDVIAAVILGGARITGGSGSVSGTLLGVLLVTLINNVLILAGVPSTWQKVIVGTFIVLAGAVFASKRSS